MMSIVYSNGGWCVLLGVRTGDYPGSASIVAGPYRKHEDAVRAVETMDRKKYAEIAGAPRDA
jgi:hypothetical protein